MSWRHPTEADWDRARDYRKHEPRPSDPLPARFQTPIAGALEVAILAQAVPLVQAAELIEQYARTVAAGARLEAVETTANRMIAAIDAHGAT